MNFNKILLTLFLLIALMASFGCGGQTQGDSKTQAVNTKVENNKPLDETTVIRICKAVWSGSDEQLDKAYPLNDLPAVAALNTPMIDCVKVIKNDIRQMGIIEDFKAYDIEYEGNHGKADVVVTHSKGKSKVTFYFIRLNGEWVMNASNIKDGGPLKLSGYDNNAIRIEGTIAHTFADETIIALGIRSLTTKRYSAGWVDPLQAVLITDQGEFPICKVADAEGPTEPLGISSRIPSRIALPFGKVKGTPKALRLIGFNELDSRGLPTYIDRLQILTLNIDSVEITKSADNN